MCDISPFMVMSLSFVAWWQWEIHNFKMRCCLAALLAVIAVTLAAADPLASRHEWATARAARAAALFPSESERARSAPLGGRSGNVSRVLTGYSWIENMWFDGTGNLFVADLYQGKVLRLRRDPATLNVTTQDWLAIPGTDRVLGITDSPVVGHVYVNVMLTNKTNFVAQMSCTQPDTWTVAVEQPLNGNGLAYNPVTGWLYAPYEGRFLPDAASIMAANVSRATGIASAPAHFFQKTMTCSDGAFVDVPTQMLYISTSVGREVLVYNVSSAADAGSSAHTFVHKYKPPGFWAMDDICVTHDLPKSNTQRDAIMFGVDWLMGAVRYFRADGSSTESTTLCSGFHHATSVRVPKGPGWEGRNAVFMSTGGLDTHATTTGEVYEVFLPA